MSNASWITGACASCFLDSACLTARVQVVFEFKEQIYIYHHNNISLTPKPREEPLRINIQHHYQHYLLVVGICLFHRVILSGAFN